MDLAFSPEQEELARTLRQFARRDLAPQSAAWDRSGQFPWEAWRRMGELGLLGLRVPAAYGGQESDFVTLGIAMEEIGRGDFACTYGIQLAGLAEREGGDYVLTGEKSGISLGMAAQSAIVFARTDPAGRARGITAFLVDLAQPGVSKSPLRDMGTRAIGRAVLSFDHVRVPASHRLGEEGTGFYQVMQGFDYNRIGIALACLGVAEQSLEETITYVKERKAFGRAIARFEGVSFPIAEAATQLEACRWLCYRAMWLADQGRPHTKESAMTKWWGPRLSVETIHQCLLLHGHYGYTDELPFEQRMRDVIGLEIGDGAAEVMKMVVARELMGRESLPY